MRRLLSILRLGRPKPPRPAAKPRRPRYLVQAFNCPPGLLITIVLRPSK